MKINELSHIAISSAVALAGLVHQTQASELNSLLDEAYDAGDNYGSTIGGPFSYSTPKASAVFPLYDSHTFPDVSGNVTARFGYLQDTFSSTFYISPPDSQNNSSYHAGYGSAQSSWSDSATISDPLRNGTTGYLRIEYSLFGEISAHRVNPLPGDNSVAAISVDCSFNGNPVGHIELTPTDADGLQVCPIHLTPAHNPGEVDYVEIQFVFGVPFNMGAALWLSNPPQGGRGTSTVKGQVTLRSLGGTVLDENLNPVTGYTSTSDSGTDWTLSQGPSPLELDSVQFDGRNMDTGVNSLTLRGLAGTSAVLETSTDLVSWASVATVDFNGFAKAFTYQGIPDEPRRFFHLRLP